MPFARSAETYCGKNIKALIKEEGKKYENLRWATPIFSDKGRKGERACA